MKLAGLSGKRTATAFILSLGNQSIDQWNIGGLKVRCFRCLPQIRVHHRSKTEFKFPKNREFISSACHLTFLKTLNHVVVSTEFLLKLLGESNFFLSGQRCIEDLKSWMEAEESCRAQDSHLEPLRQLFSPWAEVLGVETVASPRPRCIPWRKTASFIDWPMD